MQSLNLPKFPRICAATLALALFAAPRIQAATYYWDANDSTAGFGTAGGTWAAPTTNNATQGWSTSATGVNAMSGTTNTTTADALNFGTGTDGLATGTITVSGNVSAAGITFGNATGNITLTGGSITLNGGLSRIGSATTIQTINSDIVLVGARQFGANQLNEKLVFGGNISGSGASLTLDTNPTGGFVTLNGSNSFSGNLSIVRGQLNFNSVSDKLANSALGAGSKVIAGSAGGQGLVLNYTASSNGSTNRDFELNVSGGSLTITSQNAALTLSGTAMNTVANGNGILNFSGDAGGGANINHFSGAIQDNGNSTMSVQLLSVTPTSGSAENGFWKLSGNNTYSGTTTVTNAGTLIVAHSNALGTTANGTSVAASGQLLLDGGISVGAEALTLNSGAGSNWNSQTLAALRSYSGNNSWAGAITLGQATTIATNSGAGLTLSGGIGGAFNLAFNSIGDTNASGNITIGTGTLTKSGNGSLTLSGANTYTGATFINAGTLQIGAGGTAGSLSISSAITNNGTLVFNRSDALVQGTQFSSAAIAGTGSVIKNGVGNLTLNAANTYTGATTVNAGTLSIAAITNGGVAGALGNSTNAAGNLVLGGGTLLYTGANGSTDRNFTLTASTSSEINVSTAATTLTLSGTSASTNGSLAKNGSGTLVLSGNNSYTGTSTLIAGTISMGHANALGISGNITFSGGALQYGSGITTDISSRLKNSSSAILVDTNGNNIAFASAIDSTNFGGLNKNGTGTLTISGNNSYSGVTTVNGGTLEIGTAGRLGGGSYSANISNSGIFLYAGTSDQVLSGQISGAGALTKNGTGILTLSGANSYTGTTTLNAGTLRIGNNSALGTGNLVMNSASAVIDSAVGTSYTLSNNITLATNGKIGATTSIGNLTFSGIISGSGNLVLDTQSGVTTLTGLNTFTGNVIVDRAAVDGGLSFNSIGNTGVASALGAGSTISVGIGASAPYLNYIGNTAASSNRTILLAGSAAYITANSAALTWTGNITSTAQTLRLRGTGGGGANFNELSGVYSGGGSLSVETATGSDVWKISGNNTFTGITYAANNAALIAGHSNAFGSTSNGTQVINQAQLLLSGNISVGAEALTLNSAAGGTWNGQTGAALRSYTGNNSWGGALTLGQATTIATNSGAGLTLSGGISGNHNLTFNSIGDTASAGIIAIGTGTLTKNGTGILTLSGNNTYTGATTVNAGTLVLLGTNTGSPITINSGASLLSTTSLGSTTVNSGGKIAPGASANSVGSLAVAGLTLNGGGTYTWDMANATGAAGTGWDQMASSGLLTVGATSGSKFTIAITSSGVPSNWNLTSTGQTWDIITYGSLSGFAADKFAIDTTGFGGALTPDSSWALSDTGSALRLTYAYTVSTPTWAGASGNWSAGFSPAITSGANATFVGVGGTATNNIASGNLTSVGSIIFSGNGPYTLAANSGSAGFDAASALQLSGNIVNNSAASQTINLALTSNATRVYDAAVGNLTFGSSIAGTGGLTKNGTGTLTLSGNSSYSGATTVNAGTLKAGSSTGLSSGSAVSIASGATLDLGGFNNTISSLSSATGTITNTGSTANLTLTSVGSGAAQLFTGSLGLILNTSTVFTNANSTYSGGTYLNSGRLILGSGAIGVGTPGALTNGRYGTGAITVGNSTASMAQLYLDGDSSGVINNAIIVNSAQGNAPTEMGSFRIAGVGPSIAGAINANLADATFNSLNSGQTVTVTGVISGIAGLTVMTQSSGTLNVTLNNSGTANSYAGNTTISTANATLTLGRSDQIANGAAKGNLVINSGTFKMGGFNETINGLSGNGTIDGVSGTPTLTVGDNNATSSFSGVIKNTSGALALTKTGTGTLTLSGNNTYTGGTTINTGTLIIGNVAAAGTGAITQSSGSSLLKFDTTGTVSNTMSVYSVQASQSATLSGAISVNNAIFDVDSGDTLTISGAVGGSGGVTKNGTGTLVLSGSNTYAAATTINAGTLTAAHASALGSNTTVQVNGGSLLVTADDAINGKNITLASTANGSAAAASLAFSGTYNGTAGSLTLSENSTIDLGTGSVAIHFSDLAMGLYKLAIYNWTGTTLWGGGNGNNTDQFYVNRTVSDNELNRISFYSGISSSSFVGTGFQLSGGSFNQEIIPVPEPSAYLAALLLLGACAVPWIRKRSSTPR